MPRSGLTEVRVTKNGFEENHALVRKHINGWWLTADLGSCIIPVMLCIPLLVDAISGFQIESLEMIATLRKESEDATRQIRATVEAGKKKYQETVAKHARGESLR